jgi:hypothetical protein
MIPVPVKANVANAWPTTEGMESCRDASSRRLLNAPMTVLLKNSFPPLRVNYCRTRRRSILLDHLAIVD